jgi:hypothetical protein
MSSLKSFTLIVGITSAFMAAAGPAAVAIAATIAPASPAGHVVAPLSPPTLVLADLVPQQPQGGHCVNRQLPSPVVHLGLTETRAVVPAPGPLEVASFHAALPYPLMRRDGGAARPHSSSSKPRSPGVAAPTRTGQPRARAAGQPARRARWCNQNQGLVGSTAAPRQFARQI